MKICGNFPLKLKLPTPFGSTTENSNLIALTQIELLFYNRGYFSLKMLWMALGLCLVSLCVDDDSLGLRFICLHVRRLAPLHPPMHKLQKSSGGSSRVIRCKSVISVALRELPAVSKMSIQRLASVYLPVISAGNLHNMRKLRIM